ncbi:MAG: hypothetical protein JXJ04_06120 [Spirochaetales bacterium]|nr:hypothetical protein [Spirochaetales bacterium]
MKAAFINQFCSASSLSKKKELLRAHIKKNSIPDIKKLLKTIPCLSDQHRLLTMLQAEQVKGRFLKKIPLARFLSGINRDIHKMGEKVYKRIITKERKGKRFDEILLEKLGPLIRKNETIVINAVLKKLLKMPEQYLLKKAYSTFLRDLVIIMDIIKGVKDQGINRESVESNIFEQRDSLMKAGIRPLLKRFFFVDPAFEPVSDTIVTLIRKLDQQSEDEETISGAPENIRKIFFELKAETEIDKFRSMAGTLYQAQTPYIREINKLYHRLFFRPLLYCYSALRFPLDREIFRKWVEKCALETAFSEEVMSEFFRISAEFERRYSERTPPSHHEELIQLVYDSTISYTDKFKLLTTVLNVFPKTIPIRECLKKIKEVQYKCEYSFVKELTTRLANPNSRTEVDDYLSRKTIKIRNAIDRFKKSFEKLVQELQEKQFAGRKIVFDGIISAVNKENKVELHYLLALITKGEKDIGFILRLANFLLEYYFAVDFLKILARMKEFFTGYFKWGGLYLSPALSDLSKETIYNFLCDHRKDVKILLQQFTEYHERGLYEERVRESLLFELGKEYGPASLEKEKRLLTIQKNHHTYVLSIKNSAQAVLYSKLYRNLTHYHQFVRMCSDEAVGKLISLDQDEIKVLYQKAQLCYVKDLIVYLSERLAGLKKIKPLINFTPDMLKEEYLEHGESDEWTEEFLTEAHKEKDFLYSIYNNLVKEEEGDIWKDENVTERISSEKHEYLHIVQHIDSLISYVKGLKNICYGESIATGLKGRTPDDGTRFLLSELNRIDDKDNMVGTASYFLVTSTTERVISETKALIETEGIDKYRILLALYNVIDGYDDYLIKLRIIDEFAEYLREAKPEVYLQIKYLLDIQKRNIENRSHLRNEKVSDIWKRLNQIETHEDKIAFLDGVLIDSESGLLHYYVEHIRAGFMADNLKAVVAKNTDLPPAEQHELLGRFKTIYGESSLSVLERKEIVKKELELKALKELITKSKKNIFKSRDFDLLTRKPYSEGICLKNTLISMAQASRGAVEKSFLDTGISKVEIKKYLDEHYKVTASSYKDNVIINTLEDALDYFGKADDPEESGIVADIIDCVGNDRIQEALALFQDKVVLESAAKREVDRLSRLLFSLKQSDMINSCPEVHLLIEKQLKSMGGFIINKAKAQTRDDDPKVADELFSVSSEESAHENDKAGGDNTMTSVSTPPRRPVISVFTSGIPENEIVKESVEKKRVNHIQPKSIETRVKALIKDKGHVYMGKLIEYVRETYKPVINKYIKSLYNKKSDFYILLGKKKNYYTFTLVKNAVKKILKEDKEMQSHPDLLVSLEKDPGLFYVLLYELFEEKKGEDTGSYIYLPKCLDP